MKNFPIKYILILFFAQNIQTTNASTLLSVSFGKYLPIGPFTLDQPFNIIGTATNTSPDQIISICEGACIGDVNTYSLGGLASIPYDYSFYFGNGSDTLLGFLNGQLSGQLLPGDQKDFIFGVYTPTPTTKIGSYNFGVQLQIFEATIDRPMIGGASLGGTFQVVEPTTVPEPSMIWLIGAGIFGMIASRRQKIAI